MQGKKHYRIIKPQMSHHVYSQCVTIPPPKRWLGSSWTFHKPARIKCSPRSLQTLKRTTEKDTEHEHMWHTSWALRKHYFNYSWTTGQLQHHVLLTVKWWTPQGSSNSFSKEMAQLSTLLAGPASPPGVPGRLEQLLPPQPRVDMFNSTPHPDAKHPHLSEQQSMKMMTKLNIFSCHAQTCFSL